MTKVLDSTNLSRESFCIHDHLDKLQPTKNKNRYICPVCGKKNFTISKNGAYTCWNGCEREEIKRVLDPSRYEKRSNRDHHTTPINPKYIKRKAQEPKPCVIPSTAIQLALMDKIPGDIPQLINESIPKFFVEKSGIPNIAKVKTYKYSEDQIIKRYQWDDETKAKGYDKTIRPWHLDNGRLKMGKGEETWLPYRIDEAVAFGQNKWILGVEGEDGVEDARSLGIPTITWQGGSWGEADLETGLTILKNGNVQGMIFISDNDETGEKKAQALLEVSGKVDFPVLVIPASKLWNECPEKGDISDWIQWGKSQGMTTPDFIKRLEEEIQDSVNQRTLNREISKRENFKEYIKNEIENITFHYQTPRWGEEYLSDYFFKEYENELLFELDSKSWYAYSAKNHGIWSELEDGFFKQILRNRLKTIRYNIQNKNDELYQLQEEIIQEEKLEDKERKELIASLPYQKSKEITVGFIDRLAKHISYILPVKEMQTNHKNNLIPFTNGVLDLATYQLLPYSPDYLFTWQLPYDYNPLAQCDPIKQWLLETLGDESLVELIRAYFYGILTGRTDWQKYLELIGTGGAGKGTITRLAIALVGFNNCHATTLRELETNKFETSNLKNKRLVVVSEADDYVGSFNILKAILGQDPLRKEIKNRQATTFIPDCLVMISSNENIRTKDNTSGLARRRISVGFNKAVAPHLRRDLISFDSDHQPKGDFVDYIPGLLNWVLSIDPEDATALIKDSDRQCDGLAKQKVETLMATNSLAAWLQENLIYDLEAHTFIGRALRSKDEQEVFLDADVKLYPNYCRFAEGAGLKAVSLNRFRENLLDLCRHQLKLEEINDGKHRTYGKFIQGLRLRVDSDTSPPLLDLVFLGRDRGEDLRQPEKNIEISETKSEKAETEIKVQNQVVENPSESQKTLISPQRSESEICQEVKEEKEEKISSEVIESKKPSQPSQPSQERAEASQEVIPSDKELSQAGTHFDDIINETNDHLKRLGWSRKQGQKYLIKRYGKRSRQLLDDQQLLEFLAYLRNLK